MRRVQQHLSPATPVYLVAVSACLLLSACASRREETVAIPARMAAPVKYESTVTNYFDLTMPASPVPRRLAVGAPEASRCGLHGRGGRHSAWMVPVIHDTSPPGTPAAASAAAAKDKGGKSAPATVAPSTSVIPLKAKPAGNGTARPDAVRLDDVSITGTRYYFWFSGETLSAVTRQTEACP